VSARVSHRRKFSVSMRHRRANTPSRHQREELERCRIPAEIRRQKTGRPRSLPGQARHGRRTYSLGDELPVSVCALGLEMQPDRPCEIKRAAAARRLERRYRQPRVSNAAVLIITTSDGRHSARADGVTASDKARQAKSGVVCRSAFLWQSQQTTQKTIMMCRKNYVDYTEMYRKEAQTGARSR